MTQEEKTELLKIDICGRLPYSPKVLYFDPEREREFVCEVCSITEHDLSIIGGGEYVFYPYFEDVIPLLRPLSDLCAEITHAGYNDGKPFVPIVELARLMNNEIEWGMPYGSSGKCHGDYMYDGKIYVFDFIDNGFFCGFYDFEDKPKYEQAKHSPIKMNHYFPVHIKNQSFLFDLLNRLMIDYRGLIDLGLAKSVHDLDKNPYE